MRYTHLISLKRRCGSLKVRVKQIWLVWSGTPGTWKTGSSDFTVDSWQPRLIWKPRKPQSAELSQLLSPLVSPWTSFSRNVITRERSVGDFYRSFTCKILNKVLWHISLILWSSLRIWYRSCVARSTRQIPLSNTIGLIKLMPFHKARVGDRNWGRHMHSERVSTTYYGYLFNVRPFF